MPVQTPYSQYLESKRSVDDKAINRPVLAALSKELGRHPTQRLRVLEIGGGTGSMIRRCIEWSVFTHADYTMIDQDADAIAALPDILKTWADHKNLKLNLNLGSAKDRNTFSIQSPKHNDKEHDYNVTAISAELQAFLKQDKSPPYDLIIANAVLDLLDLKSILPLLWSRCAQNALFWFTINFDGESTFLPQEKQDLEVWEAYHQSMDNRTGSRYSGRRLFSELAASGATLMCAGSSDWVIHPVKGTYPAQEATFLAHIINTIDKELSEHPTLKIDLPHWLSVRRQQARSAKLIYIAHQLDFMGLAPNKNMA